jgi:hypothetical protein
VLLSWIHFAFPLFVDTCVLQPPVSTSGETASTSQVLLKGPVVRVCWCIVRVEPWVYPYANKWFCCRDRDFLEGMSRWFPSKTKIQKWIEEQEKDFAEAQNKNPSSSTKYWLGRYIFTNIHDIFFGGIHKELYEWLAKLGDTQFEIRSRPHVVWTTALIKKVKRFDNVVSRDVDLWFYSTMGGYIIEFSIDKFESYSQAEKYFFKGPRGNFLHFLKLRIKMLLNEKNILKI